MNFLGTNPESTALHLLNEWVITEHRYQFSRITPKQQAERLRASNLTSAGNIGRDIGEYWNRYHLFKAERPAAALQAAAKSVGGLRAIYAEVLTAQGMNWKRANLHTWGIIGMHHPELIYQSAPKDLGRRDWDDTAPGKSLELTSRNFALDPAAVNTRTTARETYELGFGLAALAIADIWKDTGEWLLPHGGVSSSENILKP